MEGARGDWSAPPDSAPSPSPTLGARQCAMDEGTRKVVGILATLSFVTCLGACIHNLACRSARLRFPGRLVTILGVDNMLIGLAIAMGYWVDFRQLPEANGGYAPVDDPLPRRWYNFCQFQGIVLQFLFSLAVFYCAWVSVALYYLTLPEQRIAHHRMLMRIRKHRWSEALVHLAIFVFCVSLTAVASARGFVGNQTGLVVCWVEESDHRVMGSPQLPYFYSFCMVCLFLGMVTSGITSFRLRRLITTGTNIANPHNMALLKNMIGNSCWTLTIFAHEIVYAMNVFGTWSDSVMFTLCQLANAMPAALGMWFVLDFHVVPFLIEWYFTHVEALPLSVSSDASPRRPLGDGQETGALNKPLLHGSHATNPLGGGQREKRFGPTHAAGSGRSMEDAESFLDLAFSHRSNSSDDSRFG